MDKGISKKTAQALAAKYPGELVARKVELLEYLQETRSELVDKNPAGYLRKAIEDNYEPPRGFKTKAQREAAAAEIVHQEAEEEAEEQQKREQEAQRRQAWRSQLVDAYEVGAEQIQRWEQTVAQAQEGIGPEALRRWLNRTLLVSQKNGVATVAVPYDYPSQLLADEVLETCQELLSQELGRAVTLRLEVIPYPNSE